MSLPQLIQTVSAVDHDDPHTGQHFYYSLAPEAANNPNFTVRDNQGNKEDGWLPMLPTAWAGHLGLYHKNSVKSETFIPSVYKHLSAGSAPDTVRGT